MAEEKEENNEAPAAPETSAGGSKKKILIIAAVVLLVLVAAGVPTTLLLMKKKELAEVSADAAEGEAALTIEGAEEEEELAEDEEPLGMIVPLETFVVNLSGGKYLRTQIQLEFVGLAVPPRFYSRLIPIRDGIITLLSKKKQSDFDEARGREILRNEIKDFVNEVLSKQEIKRVYFTQFIIQ